MKKMSGLILVGILSAACGRGGLSANVNSDGTSVTTQTTSTIPDFDFTDFQPDPDLEVEFPVATTITTTTVQSSTTVTTTTTLKDLIPNTTTTTLVNSLVVQPAQPDVESGDIDFDPATLFAEASKSDFIGSAMLTPTIYYVPIMDENEGKYACAVEQKVTMLAEDKTELLKVCPKTFDECKMEGTCVVVHGQQRIPINYSRYDREMKRSLWHMFDVNRCAYGIGTKSMCLDPYYTVAADLDIYKEGDVIFVPSIRGLDMGNGKKHHGFFIVRDMGHGIKERGRFDFFTGYHGPYSSKNFFKKLDLADPNTRMKYYRLKNPSNLNKYIRNLRNYPQLPSSH